MNNKSPPFYIFTSTYQYSAAYINGYVVVSARYSNTVLRSAATDYRYISVSSGHTVPISLSGARTLTDPVATSKTEDLIESLTEDYTAVVTHSIQQAARISDRTTVFLTGGELVEYDDTETIFENPESQRVEDYITGKFG